MAIFKVLRRYNNRAQPTPFVPSSILSALHVGAIDQAPVCEPLGDLKVRRLLIVVYERFVAGLTRVIVDTVDVLDWGFGTFVFLCVCVCVCVCEINEGELS